MSTLTSFCISLHRLCRLTEVSVSITGAGGGDDTSRSRTTGLLDFMVVPRTSMLEMRATGATISMRKASSDKNTCNPLSCAMCNNRFFRCSTLNSQSGQRGNAMMASKCSTIGDASQAIQRRTQSKALVMSSRTDNNSSLISATKSTRSAGNEKELKSVTRTTRPSRRCLTHTTASASSPLSTGQGSTSRSARNASSGAMSSHAGPLTGLILRTASTTRSDTLRIMAMSLPISTTAWANKVASDDPARSQSRLAKTS
mmetsp:Transcript_31532/g.84166  ORF Transcript_31532/g.84166 Transcript_31532/m.84166 type:complete len:257 (+) Transcript_31532:328-1098(+)